MALPYTIWKVSEDKELKLRLTSSQGMDVEEKIGANLLKVFMPAEGEAFALPPLKVMLLLTHGALQRFEHGLSFKDVSDLYDDYVDNGGDQAAFMADVILPMLQVSGFMPREKASKKTPKKSKAEMKVVE
ncbi:DUF6096 family protein [Streptococcus oralis]|uniref:DUF6096 family protein n=1 Tax=Streptococcus oralis TaxID=1303 RepID=UPI00228496C6|nr:DUF6096 family protein [Streptococcus oralis]MCY7087226.1 DUF6096 family protein [Streptococcus oralis]